MPQRHSKYQVCWEVEFKFLKVGPSEYEAHCIDCNSVFLVKNGGHSDVIKHVNGKRHKKIQEQNCVISRNVSDNSINVNEGKDINNNNNECYLTPEEKVVKAETLQALKFVSCNYSFASAADWCDSGWQEVTLKKKNIY